MSEKPNYLQITRFNSIRHEKIMFFLKTTPFSQKVNRGVDASCQSSGVFFATAVLSQLPCSFCLLGSEIESTNNQLKYVLIP